MSKLLLVVIYFFILLSFKINALDSQNIKSAAEKSEDKAYPVINSQKQEVEKFISQKAPEVKSEKNTDTTFVLNEKISLSKIMEIDQDDILLGNKEAKIIIFEYSSPTCPHCSHFRKMLFPQIIKNYIDKGLVLYVIREVIGNRQDLDASILINCAPKEDAYKFLEIIYTQQDNWAFNINYKDNLMNIGKIGGLSNDSYKECLLDEELSMRLIKITNSITKNSIFLGTPSFFMKYGEIVENIPVNQLIKKIDETLKNN